LNRSNSVLIEGRLSAPHIPGYCIPQGQYKKRLAGLPRVRYIAHMHVLLSTIGSRGDVQPLVAIALQLRAQGHQCRLCAPPDFRDLSDAYGLPFVPVGPEVRPIASQRAAGMAMQSPEAMRQLLRDTIAGQFATLAEAAEGCDVIVAATALQYAARSIAEQRGIRYFFAAYSPIVLPSAHHAPPPMPGQLWTKGTADNRALWDQQAQRWNELFGPALNEQRAAAGLDRVTDVRSYMFTAGPLLAADPILAPWPIPSELAVLQTGAWIIRDERPLPVQVEEFLTSGEPPIYFGFGSTHVSQETGRTMIDAARALGRRAIILGGWSDLVLAGNEPDCLSITEINLQALFPRVAAVVHHGGAGTTTTAARAAAPQVVVPHRYDQHYFADRVHQLNIGFAHAPTAPTTDSLAAALNLALQPEVAVRAKSLATAVRTDGAARAADYVTR
jgi:vancomycin aglycone glucosyltransferase